jgi:hypothetical protein
MPCVKWIYSTTGLPDTTADSSVNWDSRQSASSKVVDRQVEIELAEPAASHEVDDQAAVRGHRTVVVAGAVGAHFTAGSVGAAAGTESRTWSAGIDHTALTWINGTRRPRRLGLRCCRPGCR